MRIIFFYLLVFFQYQASASELNINIYERTKHAQYINNIFEVSQVRLQNQYKDLAQLIEALPSKTKMTVKRFINKFDRLIPEKSLIEIIYWRFIKPDSEKLASSIKKLLYHRYYVALENASLQLHSSKGHEYIDQWFHQVQTIIPMREQAHSQKRAFFIDTNAKDLIELKANTIAQITAHNDFQEALLKSPEILSQELYQKIGARDIHHFIDAIGPILGNEISSQYVKKKGLIALLNQARESVILSDNLYSLIGEKGRLIQNIGLDIFPVDPRENLYFAILDGHREFPTLLYISSFPASNHFYILKVKGPAAALAAHKLNSQTDLHAIKNILTRKTYPIYGEETIRTISLKDQHLYWASFINNSQNTLYIKSTHLYDSFIVDALIRRQAQGNIDIRVLLSLDTTKSRDGMPYIIYIEQILDAGIPIMALGAQTSHLPNNFAISDGNRLFLASCNIKLACHQSDSSAFSISAFGSMAANKKVEFLNLWDNPRKTMIFNLEDFQTQLRQRTLSQRASQLYLRAANMFLRMWRQESFKN